MREGQVTLDDGTHVTCDLVVVGAGVAPAVELAATAGLHTDNGVVVDDMLRTSHPDIFAAGDIAAWPDPHSGRRIRVEHWVVAERQGQVAARNMLGAEIRFQDVPFFWTKQFDFSLTYLGHAEDWEKVEVDGNVAKSDATVRYVKAGRVQAAAFVGRELDCLRQREAMMASLEPAAKRK